jgi:hypothetical protein
MPSVAMVINLHDGSGFYRPTYIDKLHNPYKWGNSSIIDQEILPNIKKYKNIKKISDAICEHVNKNLLKKEHYFRTKNTHTKFKKTKEEKEMSKTLTYFAITHGKAAIGNESSKSLPTHERVYYKLLSIEKLMDEMGIEYKRKFNLTPKDIKYVLNNDISISFYGKKIHLPLSQIKNIIKYFPVQKNGLIDFKASNPLMTVLKNKGYYTIQYGNRRLVKLSPDYFDIDTDKNTTIKFKIDGKETDINFGSIVDVKNDFYIYPNNNFRVNIIGYKNKKYKNESGIKIKKHFIPKRFSLDKKGTIYRIEFYKQNSKSKDKFAGMILIRFNKKS